MAILKNLPKNKQDFLWRLKCLPHGIIQIIDGVLNLLTFNMLYFRYSSKYIIWVAKADLKKELDKQA